MRAKEFISEDRQKLDEIAPLVIAGWALTAGTAAWQAYDTYNDIQTYNKSGKTEADLDKLKAAIGMDTLALVAGGAAGKLVGKTISLGATPFKAVKNIYNARKQAAAAKQAAEKSAKAAEKVAKKTAPMKSVKTPGASTSIGSTATKATQPKTVTGKVGAVAGKVVDKAKDVAGKLKPKKAGVGAAGAAAGKLAKKKLPSKVGKPAGKIASKTGSKVGKPLGKKLLPYAAGALAGKGAKAGYDAFSKEFDDWQKNRNAANTAGANSYVYTGDKKDPPKSDFVAKNLDLQRLKVKK